MKKGVLSFLFFMVVAVNSAHAGKYIKETQLFTNEAMSTGVAETSAAVSVYKNIGFMVLFVTEDIAGGAGDVDIYAEYSLDGTNWYRPYTSDMAGAIVLEGNIVEALQNVTRYIVFTPRLGQLIRIVVDPDANSQVTARLLWQEEK